MCVCAKSLQSCQTLCDPMDCSPPGSSVPGILQARILEWVAMPSSRGSSQPRDWTHVSCISSIGRGFFTTCATWEVHLKSEMEWNWQGRECGQEDTWAYPRLRGWGVCLCQGPPAPERLKLTRSCGISLFNWSQSADLRPLRQPKHVFGRTRQCFPKVWMSHQHCKTEEFKERA